MDASRRPPPTPPSSSPPGSREAQCPGCGKAIDPLRAGQVAILDGSFRYFCGPDCKVAFVDVTSRRSSLEALTAEPPTVSELEEEARSVTSGVRAHEAAPATEGMHAEEEVDGRVAPHFPEPADSDARAIEEAPEASPLRPLPDEEDESDDVPSTLRSKAIRAEVEARADAEPGVPPDATESEPEEPPT